MEAARAMLHDQDLPMHLWAEAARTAVYVQNRTPHRVRENKNPEEFFSRKKPIEEPEEAKAPRIHDTIMNEETQEEDREFEEP